MLFKIFKYLGLFLLCILVLLAVVYYKSVNYSRFPIKIKKDHFSALTPATELPEIVEALIAEMSLEEKLNQLYAEEQIKGFPKMIVNLLLKDRFPHIYAGRNERLGIPPFVLSDGPRGAVVGEGGNTCFPVAMARGASWDVDLERRVATVMAKEVRANGCNYLAAPCINILRHPAWGRAQETYGEDPWHMGEMGLAYTQAVQPHQVMACPKHFALNSIENSRFWVDVRADERTLREVYLPHFKKVIQEGQSASLMSAYNKVRGEYCGNNAYLLTQILREEWGFKGFVTSDWVEGTQAGVASIRAGLDMEMPFQKFYGDELREAIADGSLQEAELDAVVRRILNTRLRYAMADDPMDYPESIKASDEHTRLAQEVAEKSMVLLKNEQILPFSKESGKTIAVIGRLADRVNTGDKGSSRVRTPYVITPYQGLKNYHESLGNQVVYHDGSDLTTAAQLAEEADEVILITGYSFEEEGEFVILNPEKHKAEKKTKGDFDTAGDRMSLELIEADQQLIQQLSGKNANTVVVLIGGSAILMEGWKDQVPAILMSWYSGMEGGTALARLLYGEQSPSGKLPFTLPKQAEDLPFFTPFTDSITYGYYHGYTLFDKENKTAAYPFGYGLSYTTFSYDSLQIRNRNLTPEDALEVSVQVQNTGEMDAEEVVQLYIGFSNSSVDRPVKLLRAFDKVFLKKGSTQKVNLKVDLNDLRWYNPDTQQWELETMKYELYVGRSSATKDLITTTFTINP